MKQSMFSSDVELGKFLGSVDLIPYAFQAISEASAFYQLQTSPSGIQVLVFKCLPDYTSRFLKVEEFGLVSSQNHQVNGFISTKVNPEFCISKAAVELFDQHLFHKLSEINSQLVNGPLVVTGRGLGGYLAILFALWKQHAIDVQESNGSKNIKRPICITFGSPLVGDKALQQAISERPQWSCRFLNVVAKNDHVATLFPSKNSEYKPFGTFMFCTESGGNTAFENQEAILAVLDAMATSNVGGHETCDYQEVLRSVRRKVLYRGVSELGNFDLNPLKAGITSQFREVGVLGDISNDLIKSMEVKIEKKIWSQRNSYDPARRLNMRKIDLTFIEWYMKSCTSKGGYYDCYRNESRSKGETVSHGEIVKRKGFLDQYWKDFVTEKDLMPQLVGANLRTRWLHAGNNYRRIIEPLHIAEYYRKGGKNYIEKRSNHFTLLENWLNQSKVKNQSDQTKVKPASLTEDSCFWAYVEEARISLTDLKNGDPKLDKAKIEHELIDFEKKLMGEIKDYSVSPDIFVKDSSLMKWWSDYKAYKGDSYDSEFAQYMDNMSYKKYQALPQ